MNQPRTTRPLLSLLLLLTGCVNNNLGTSELTTGSAQIHAETMPIGKGMLDAYSYLKGITAAADGTVQLLDIGKNRILRMPASGGASVMTSAAPVPQSDAYGAGLPGPFYVPTSLSQDSQGDLWVGEIHGDAVVERVSPTGRVETIVPRATYPDLGQTVTVIADRTNAIYLHTDGMTSNTQTIWRVETQGTLRKVTDFTAPSFNNRGNLLVGLAAAPTGGLIALNENRQLFTIDDKGAVATLRNFAPQGDPAVTLMSRPQAISADRKGNVFVLGRRSASGDGPEPNAMVSWFIQKIDPQGRITPVLTCRYTNVDPVPFPGIRIAAAMPSPVWTRALTLTSGADDKLYVADAIEDRVLRITMPPEH